MSYCKPLLLATAVLAVTACSTDPQEEAVSAPVAAAVLVDESNFIKAETVKYFNSVLDSVPLNKFKHERDFVTVETQDVIRQNRDALYSKAVISVARAALIKVPEYKGYLTVQLIDEDHNIIDVLHAGDNLWVEPDDVQSGRYIYAIIRILPVDDSPEAMKAAHVTQDNVSIDSFSDEAYQGTVYDQASLHATRTRLEARIPEVNIDQAFGVKGETAPTAKLVGAAIGWGGLSKDLAQYTPLPLSADVRSGECSSMTVPHLPVQYDDNGFWSITAYDDEGWIATKDYALSSNTAVPNEDGTTTIHFNCDGAINNIQVVQNWKVIMRTYTPENVDELVKARAAVQPPVIKSLAPPKRA